jgi:hypothetical protein
MDTKLIDLIDSLTTLRKTVDDANFNDNAFDQQHGWNQLHIQKTDVSNLIYNLISKLNSYGDAKITIDLSDSIDGHISNVTRLDATARSYFTNTASHLLHMVPSIILTLLTIFNDIESELFSYENIQDKKLLPRNLSARLRSTKARLDTLNESSEDLQLKVNVINDAHEAAESLPTDLASLQEARLELSELIKSSKNELTETKKELEQLKIESLSLKNETRKSSDEAEQFKIRTKKYADESQILVEQCDDALQITTTQGLAAGFDQKAKELKLSIWVWIVGLLIALSVGAVIGDQRVEAFSAVLGSDLTAGQAVLHTIMSIFSIGGPLWLAWISTQQINQRFKLSEDYSYKATVAKSFTGFSKFAERFDPSTEARLFNSTLDRLDEMPLRLIEGKDYNSPWHEFIDSDAFKSAIEVMPTLAKEASKFANKTQLKKKPKKSTKSNTESSIEKMTSEDNI